jgi:hypothetical protein
MLAIAFSAGVVGAGALYLARRGLAQVSFLDLPALPSGSTDRFAELYRLLVWGGIWGLPLALPLLNRQWWMKGVVLGVLATLVARFYFRPNLQISWELALYAVALNVLWGIVAAFFWSFLTDRREAPRRFGLYRS